MHTSVADSCTRLCADNQSKKMWAKLPIHTNRHCMQTFVLTFWINEVFYNKHTVLPQSLVQIWSWFSLQERHGREGGEEGEWKRRWEAAFPWLTCSPICVHSHSYTHSCCSLQDTAASSCSFHGLADAGSRGVASLRSWGGRLRKMEGMRAKA